jgi:HK97 family phage major capsid protein
MWLADKVLQEFTLQENTGFVSGNGVKQPKGFTTYTTAATADASRAFGQLEHVATGANGAFKTASATVNPADDLLTLIGKFKKPYRPNLRWAMNRVTVTGHRHSRVQGPAGQLQHLPPGGHSAEGHRGGDLRHAAG